MQIQSATTTGPRRPLAEDVLDNRNCKRIARDKRVVQAKANLPPRPLQPRTVGRRCHSGAWVETFGEFPAGKAAPDRRFARLSLHSYSRHGLVYRQDLVPSHFRVLEAKVAAAIDAVKSRRSLQNKGSKAVQLRGSLAEWIHVHGGLEVLRLLSGAERDRALGFRSFFLAR